MSEWLGYALSDLLLFSPRVYFRMLELHNEALWPLQLVTLAVGLAVLVLAVRGGVPAGRVAGVLLGLLWMWVAWSFLWERYATINWAVAYIAPVFLVQGAALGLFAARGDLTPTEDGWRRWAGIALLVAAIILYPLVAPVLGRPWSAAEVFGMMPDPTAVATLAYLALSRRGGPLMIVPALWCALASETLWLLDAPGFFIPIAAALAAVFLRIARKAQSTATT
jgi:hypothetical protein